MVIDASAWLEVVTGRVDPAELLGAPLATPAHFDAEVLSGLRGVVRAGHLEAAAGDAWWEATRAAPIERIPLAWLADLWRRSAALGAHDAPYVAAAIRDRGPLLTADARLARGAAGLCEIRLLTG